MMDDSTVADRRRVDSTREREDTGTVLVISSSVGEVIHAVDASTIHGVLFR